MKFKIWERGSIGIDELRSFLISDVKRALCDVFLEYFLLVTPLSEVPPQFHYHYASRSSDLSGLSTSPCQSKYTSKSATLLASTPFTQVPLVSKRFLSEPPTPAERRSGSPAEILRNKSLNEAPVVREPISRKSSRDSPKESIKKQQAAPGSLEKTYETLEDYFPLNKSGNVESESPAPRQTDSESTSVKDSGDVTSCDSVSVIDEGKVLPELHAFEDPPLLGSPYDTLTDREVEESFNATLYGDNGTDKREPVWHEIEHRRRRDNDARRLRRKYERGEIGSLHPWLVTVDYKILSYNVLVRSTRI